MDESELLRERAALRKDLRAAKEEQEVCIHTATGLGMLSYIATRERRQVLRWRVCLTAAASMT
jgi:hypothetical protein